jgi:hypothetical protein
MKVTEAQIRTDGPIPTSIVYENGVRRMTWKQGELEAYVLEYPDAVFRVNDSSGNLITYKESSIIRQLLVDAGCLPSDTQSR